MIHRKIQSKVSRTKVYFRKGSFTSMAPTLRRSLGSILCFGLAAFGSTAAPGFAYQPPTAEALDLSSQSFVMRPGVVVDPARGRLYAMVKDGVAAYDTGSEAAGKAIWQSEGADRPLGLFGPYLVALAEPNGFGTAEIVMLDIHTGDVVSQISAALPEGTGGWVVDRPHQSFQADTTVVTTGVGGELFLTWSFFSRPLRGMPVASGEESQALKRLEGAFRLDPAARTAQPVDAAAAPRSESRRFDLSSEERLVGVEGRQFRSGNDQHVLASEKTDNDPWNVYRWTVLHRGEGKVIGRVDRPVSTARFFVDGETLVHESSPFHRRSASGEFETHGLRLVAVDLTKGREIWSIDLRDTVFRGVLPP